MDCSDDKLKKVDRFIIIFSICFLLIFLLIWAFPLYGLCADIETLEPSISNGIIINANGNYFISSSGSTAYVKMEKGYIYHIIMSNDVPSVRRIAVCDQVPALNVSYDYLGSFEPGTTFDYIPSSDSYFLCSSPQNNYVTFSREKIGDMSGTVKELASVVSPNAFWNIFDISINYIVVVVLVAFGIYIIFRIIRKISKGKEGL